MNHKKNLTCKEYREEPKENPEVPGDAEESVKPFVETKHKSYIHIVHILALKQTYKLREAKTRHHTWVEINGSSSS